MHHRLAPTLLAAACLAILPACGDGGPGGAGVSGDWSGFTAFNSGFTTSMTLTQSGTTVTGTFTISGGPRDNPLTGTVDTDARTLAWASLSGCNAWGGVLTLSARGDSLTGQVLHDASGCVPARSNSTGTMTLTR